MLSLPSPLPRQVFHLLNFLVCSLRSGVFAFRYEVQELPYSVVQAGLLDLPGEHGRWAAWGRGPELSTLVTAGLGYSRMQRLRHWHGSLPCMLQPCCCALWPTDATPMR